MNVMIHLAVCAHCAFPICNGALRLCEDCYCRAWAKLSDCPGVSRTIRGLPVSALASWEDDPILDSLIYAQKGGHARELTESLGRKLALQAGNRDQEHVYVPAPATTDRAHSRSLAVALSRVTGHPIRNLLRREPQSRAQKFLSKKDREQARFLAENIDAQIKFIFVDDVVTTGATALAAYIALGRPKTFEVWCIGCRELRGLL